MEERRSEARRPGANLGWNLSAEFMARKSGKSEATNLREREREGGQVDEWVPCVQKACMPADRERLA